MSKASELAKQYRACGRFQLPDDGGKKATIAEITLSGEMTFYHGLDLNWTYKAKDAIAFARWILATFGEGRSARSVALARRSEAKARPRER